MAEPRIRFKKDDHSYYSALTNGIMGDFYSERNERGNANLPMLTVSIHNGVSDGELDEEELGKRVKRSADMSQYKKAVSGDLVFNMMRAWQGAVGCVKTTGIVSPAYIVAVPNEDIYPPFMDYYVQTKKVIDRFNRLSYGALDFRKRLYWDSFVTTAISIPCIEEQKKIANFLSSVDEVISNSKQEVTNLETQKKAVMKKIFSQEVRFKKADGSDFPEWEEKVIREFAQCIAGATPSTKVDDYWKDGTIPWMSSGEVNKGLIFETDTKITELGYDNTSTKMVPAETVVMALAGQGKTRGMVALTKIELCTNQSLCSIVSDGSVNSAYLYQYLIMQYQNLRQVSSGDGTRGGLNLKLVGDYYVLIPCLEEQHLIADFLSDFDEAIAAAKKELELWKELKKGLLQQMFV